ncbi:hypothetical protein ABPG75_001711 [Micractinium tetrahymenae]
MLGPKDYEALLASIKSQSNAGINLWVAVPAMDWQHIMALGFERVEAWLDYSDPLIRAAVAAAVDAGFPLVGKPEARIENVFVAMHSLSSTFYPGVPMKHCAGAVLLGATIDGSSCPAVPDAAALPRSVMHITGALDGQLRLPRAAWLAAHTAPLAAQVGPRHFAQVRPFAIVPGMNHAQFSNGVVNSARGDIPSDVPIKTQAEAVAGLLAAFAAANHPEATEESARQEIEQLLQATTASFDLLTPFLEAAGRGSPTALLAAGSGDPAAAAEVEARAFGAERLSHFTPNRNSFSHVGELEAAERFARAAQRRMLAAGLPAGAGLSGVRVAVTSHTQLDTFIYSQPTVFQTETPVAPPVLATAGKQWVVHAHVYLFWEYYQPGFDSMLKPMSPQYIMKLKKGAALALAMGLEAGSDGVVTGAELNEATYHEALAAAPQLFVETLGRRGKQLKFAPDRDVTKEIRTPVDWIQMPLSFEPGEDGQSIVLTCPSVDTPTAPLPAFDRGPGRMAGNHYVKASSPAWMHEWIMIEGLRR